MTAAVEQARSVWGDRLLAAYALGSLAHGGFSALVSDVDFGIALAAPLAQDDVEGAAALAEGVRGSGLELADRLSVFWGSRDTLAGSGTLGRFPAIDRLDLIRYGQLLFGQDIRAGLQPPSREGLTVQGAQAGLGLLGRPEYQKALADPGSLLSGEPKPLTKTVLFPVRFVFTLRTGEIGRNYDAVKHFLSTERGPAAELTAAAFRWRDQAPAADDLKARMLLERGLHPIWQIFVKEHAKRMASYGLGYLADQLLKAQL